jgi:hypothetical protein
MIARANAEFEKARVRHEEVTEALRKRREELEQRREELEKDEVREAERWEADQRRHEEVRRSPKQ